MTNQLYYHGSAVPGIKSLEPRSKLHNNIAKDVLYLTSSAPYALVYIWSEEKDTSVNKDYCMHKPKRLAFLNGILNRLGIWDESDSFVLFSFFPSLTFCGKLIENTEEVSYAANGNYAILFG